MEDHGIVAPSDRARFEQWMHGDGANLMRHQRDRERYASATVQARWRTWLAAIASERFAVKKP